ncbi:MAG: DUF4421 family protein [Chitinophagaceae bacterium]
MLLLKESQTLLRRSIVIIASFFAGVWSAVYGQDSAMVYGRVTDSGYVEKFNNWIHVKAAVINTSETFISEGDNFKQVLKANPSQIFRTYVNYRFIAFYVDYIPHFLPGNNDEAEKGRSKGIGFGTGLTFQNWFTEIGFSKTKGYYLENTKDYQPGWQPGDPYFQVPDFHVTSFDGAVGYNTNPRLSLVATSSQTARQIKSAGAFIPKIIYRYLVLDNRSANQFSTQKGNHLRTLLGAGYQHTFVLNRSFYLTGAFTPYFGYIFTTIRTRDNTQVDKARNNGPVYQWDAKLGLGYNGHRFFAGTYLTAGAAKFSQGLSTATQQDATVFFQLFAGIRLQAPKSIDRIFDKF